MDRRLRIFARWLAAPAFCTLIAGVVLFNDHATSPGALTRTHAQVAELRGAAGCERCHGDERVSLRDACAACHTAIEDQLRARRGLHGRQDSAAVAECGHCHKEHRGAHFSAVGERAFRLAGAPGGRDGYLHEGLDFALAGRHGELACKACHAHADDPVLRPETRRFLGLEQACTKCHKDPHEGELQDCAGCHGQEHPFGAVARFEHDPRFPLVGSHAGVLCKKCHVPGSARSVEALAPAQQRRGLPVRACAECHRSGHTESFLAVASAAARVAPAATCERCHAAAHDGFHGADQDLTRRLHEGFGFDLTPPHDRATCKECHQGIGTPAGPDAAQARAARFPGRTAEQCERCHTDPHRAQFKVDAFAGAACRTCHSTHRFAPSMFTAELHSRTRLPLTGAHAAVGCQQCHKLARGVDPGKATIADRVFAGTDTACASCHEDVHRGAFSKPGHPQEIAGRAGCARCHDTTSFRVSALQRFDHGRWTGYALTGAHAEAACARCHPPSRAPRGDRRTLGKAISTRCADCHRDPHAGQFAKAGSTDCARCHDTAGFKLATFDHARQTRFALDENHARLKCGCCHKPYPLPAGGEVVRYRPLGTKCADCHGWESIEHYRQRRGVRR